MAATRDTLRQAQALRTAVATEADSTATTLGAAWVKAWVALAAPWQAAGTALATSQADLGRYPHPWELSRLDRLQIALQATGTALATLAATATADLAAATGRSVAAGIDAEPVIAASQLPEGDRATAAKTFAAALAASAVAALTARLARQVAIHARPVGDATTEAIHRHLVRGIAPATLADSVKTLFDGGLHQATTIAQTSAFDAARAAQQAIDTANRATIATWSWHCQCTTRSCIACWVMDGTEYPADTPGPDGHQSCQCVRLPVARSWSSLGYGQHEPDTAIQPARDRFDALPEADQVKVMGATRLDLYRSGAVQWANLATRRDSRTWRPSYVPTTVRDLHRVAARQPA